MKIQGIGLSLLSWHLERRRLSHSHRPIAVPSLLTWLALGVVHHALLQRLRPPHVGSLHRIRGISISTEPSKLIAP